jgi:hypothetical protein
MVVGAMGNAVGTTGAAGAVVAGARVVGGAAGSAAAALLCSVGCTAEEAAPHPLASRAAISINTMKRNIGCTFITSSYSSIK